MDDDIVNSVNITLDIEPSNNVNELLEQNNVELSQTLIDTNEPEAQSQSQENPVPENGLQQPQSGYMDLPDGSNTWGECTVTTRQFPFVGQEGLLYDFDVNDPMEVFSQFFTEEIVQLIVTETNDFAHNYLRTHELKQRSLMRHWIDCDGTEIRQFFGIIIIMGMNPLPKMRLYWSNNDVFENVKIKKIMKRDRFEAILKCLHFEKENPNPNQPEHRLGKIKKLIDMLNLRFKTVRKPGESVVVDETMAPWCGRLIFRQYNPQKAHKYGIKIYKICSEDSYTFQFKVYAGLGDITGREGHAQKMIIYLMSELLGEGRTVYADNFYNTVPLAEFLIDKQTYICGTLRSDRVDNPKDVVKKNVKKGEVFGLENEKGVKVMKWKDKRPVLMITTRAEDMPTLTQTGKVNRANQPIMKPSSVIAYNKAKKGVDVSDQLSAYYTPLRKTLKWYKKLAIELLLGTSVVNALVIFNDGRNRRNKYDMLKFRMALVEKLTQDRQPVPIPVEVNRRRRMSDHKLVEREGTARKNRKRCLPCYKELVQDVGTKEARKRAKKVTTFCENCPQNPTMCLLCFNKHKK